MEARQFPRWLSELRAEGWANIHDLVPTPPRLTGVDSFCGDWNAHTLLVGKDFAPASELRRRLADGDSNPYRHNPELHTNVALKELLATVGIDAPLDGSRAGDCRVFYSNAYYLLRDDGKFSGRLPNARAARSQSQPVFHFLFEELPKLERILTLGEDSFRAVCEYLCVKNDWRMLLESRGCIRVERIKLFALCHPGFWGSKNRRRGASAAERAKLIADDWKAAFGC